MNTFLKNLFDYNHHCNKALIKTMIENKASLPERALHLFSHVLNAHHVWNCKIQNAEPFFTLWQMHDVFTLEYTDKRTYFDSLLIIDEHELLQQINYTTGMGGVYTDTVQDILFNIINHSTYHRGQIAIEFRNAGIEPLLTDYIFHKTQKNSYNHEYRLQLQ